jgi:CMP-N,N'-diacetyllegionaminic acid synthase
LKTYFIDMDNTICQTEGTDYASAYPWPDRIAVVNRLFDAGHRVVIWTARGSLNGVTLALRQLTKRQLAEWGVKHHELRLDKPFFDVLVDDRALSSLMEVA